MAAISEQLLFFLQTQANPIPKTFVYNAQIAVLDNAPFRTRAGPALPFVRTGVFDEMRTVPDHPAGIKLVIENRANRARRPTGELFAGARPRSRYLFAVERCGDRLERHPVGRHLKNAPDQLRFTFLDHQARTTGLAFDAIAKTSPARVETTKHLTVKAAMRLSSKLLDVERIDQAVDSNQDISLFVRTVDILRDGDDADAGEIEALEDGDRIDQAAGKPAGVVDQNDIEGSAGVESLIEQTCESRAVRARAGDRLVGINRVIGYVPAKRGSIFPADADLVGDGNRVLLIGGIPSVDRAAKTHFKALTDFTIFAEAIFAKG